MKKVHWYYKFLIVFIVFYSMFFLLNKNISYLIENSNYHNYMNYVASPIGIINKYNILNYKQIIKQNEKLQKQILKNNTNNELNLSLKQEIESLKQVMNIKNTYTNYNLIYAKTTIRNKMYWYSTVTIDKGSENGIEENDPVLSKDGLIGTIKSVTKNSSRVKLITNSDKQNKISVMVKADNETKIGLIEDYEYPYLKIVLTTDNSGLTKGNKVYTSGLGNLPKNIFVGSIEKIEKDDYKLSTILYVKPKQDMNDINYVVVLKKK